MQTTETFGDDGSGPPTPPRDKAQEVKKLSDTVLNLQKEIKVLCPSITTWVSLVPVDT